MAFVTTTTETLFYYHHHRRRVEEQLLVCWNGQKISSNGSVINSLLLVLPPNFCLLCPRFERGGRDAIVFARNESLFTNPERWVESVMSFHEIRLQTRTVGHMTDSSLDNLNPSRNRRPV